MNLHEKESEKNKQIITVSKLECHSTTLVTKVRTYTECRVVPFTESYGIVYNPIVFKKLHDSGESFPGS